MRRSARDHAHSRHQHRVYLMKGHPLAAGYLPHLAGNRLAISFMTVAELHEGARRANWGLARLAKLESVIGQYVVVPSSPGICRRWAEVRYARRMQPISHEDAWIAATATELALALVTHNFNDFTGIPGLNVISTYVA